jgi:hypothetical protein
MKIFGILLLAATAAFGQSTTVSNISVANQAPIPNDGTTGTTAYTLTTLTTAGNAVRAAGTEAFGIIGVSIPLTGSTIGTTGSVVVANQGIIPLQLNNTPTAGDFVEVGTFGIGHDFGINPVIATTQCVGRVATPATALPSPYPSSTYLILWNLGCGVGSGGGGGSGSVSSVTFTGDGVVLSSTPSAPVTTSGTVTATLKSQTANTIFGAATTTPSWLTVPSCSGAANALTWTTGTGFGCNTISGGGGGLVTPSSGGTGIASPTAHSLLVTEGSSTMNLVTSPSVNGFYNCGFNVTGSAAVDPTCALSGVPVNAQGSNYSLVYSDRLSYILETSASNALLTLPQISGSFGSNFAFVTQNLNGGTDTLQANAADKIDGSGTGGSSTIPPGWASFVYSDSSSAPGNWWTIRFPTANAAVVTHLTSALTANNLVIGNGGGDETIAPNLTYNSGNTWNSSTALTAATNWLGATSRQVYVWEDYLNGGTDYGAALNNFCAASNPAGGGTNQCAALLTPVDLVMTKPQNCQWGTQAIVRGPVNLVGSDTYCKLQNTLAVNNTSASGTATVTITNTGSTTVALTGVNGYITQPFNVTGSTPSTTGTATNVQWIGVRGLLQENTFIASVPGTVPTGCGSSTPLNSGANSNNCGNVVVSLQPVAYMSGGYSQNTTDLIIHGLGNNVDWLTGLKSGTVASIYGLNLSGVCTYSPSGVSLANNTLTMNSGNGLASVTVGTAPTGMTAGTYTFTDSSGFGTTAATLTITATSSTAYTIAYTPGAGYTSAPTFSIGAGQLGGSSTAATFTTTLGACTVLATGQVSPRFTGTWSAPFTAQGMQNAIFYAGSTTSLRNEQNHNYGGSIQHLHFYDPNFRSYFGQGIQICSFDHFFMDDVVIDYLRGPEFAGTTYCPYTSGSARESVVLNSFWRNGGDLATNTSEMLFYNSFTGSTSTGDVDQWYFIGGGAIDFYNSSIAMGTQVAGEQFNNHSGPAMMFFDDFQIEPGTYACVSNYPPTTSCTENTMGAPADNVLLSQTGDIVRFSGVEMINQNFGYSNVAGLSANSVSFMGGKQNLGGGILAQKIYVTSDGGSPNSTLTLTPTSNFVAFPYDPPNSSGFPANDTPFDGMPLNFAGLSQVFYVKNVTSATTLVVNGVVPAGAYSNLTSTGTNQGPTLEVGGFWLGSVGGTFNSNGNFGVGQVDFWGSSWNQPDSNVRTIIANGSLPYVSTYWNNWAGDIAGTEYNSGGVNIDGRLALFNDTSITPNTLTFEAKPSQGFAWRFQNTYKGLWDNTAFGIGTSTTGSSTEFFQVQNANGNVSTTGSLSVGTTSLFTGVATFTAAPVFSGGISGPLNIAESGTVPVISASSSSSSNGAPAYQAFVNGTSGNAGLLFAGQNCTSVTGSTCFAGDSYYRVALGTKVDGTNPGLFFGNGTNPVDLYMTRTGSYLNPTLNVSAAISAISEGLVGGGTQSNTLTVNGNTNANNELTAIAILSGGTGATNGTSNITLTGGSCSTFPIAQVTAAGGIVTAVSVVNGGNGCTGAVLLTVPGSTATFTYTQGGQTPAVFTDNNATGGTVAKFYAPNLSGGTEAMYVGMANSSGNAAEISFTQGGTNYAEFGIAGHANALQVDPSGNVYTNFALSLVGTGSNIAALATGAGGVVQAATVAGSGAGLTTGPVTSVSGDVVTFTGTGGQIQDSGKLLTALASLNGATFTAAVNVQGGNLTVGTGGTPEAFSVNCNNSGSKCITVNDSNTTAGTQSFANFLNSSLPSGSNYQFNLGVANSTDNSAVFGYNYNSGTPTSSYGYFKVNGTTGITVDGNNNFTAVHYQTSTRCSSNGTAANPSVVSCSAATAGAFSCSVSASAGTCTINDSAVTANSTILVTLAPYEGTLLSQTCNTVATQTPIVSAITGGTSFTLTLPTLTTNPECYTFEIIN